MTLPRFAVTTALFLLLAACNPGGSDDAPVKLGLPTTKSECIARGGTWTPHEPDLIVSGCHLATTDGGKACSSSNQCESECVEAAGGNSCATSFDGCFSPTGRGTVTQCVN